MAKTQLIKQMQAASPQLYNAVAVDTAIFRMAGIDSAAFFNAQPTPPPPDPRMEAIKAKAQASMQQSQIDQLREQIRIETEKARLADREQERISREKIAQMQIQLELLRIEEERVINEREEGRNITNMETDLASSHAKASQEAEIKAAQTAEDLASKREAMVYKMQSESVGKADELQRERDKHMHDMQVAREKHDEEMAMLREKHQAELEHARLIARAKASSMKSKPKGKSGG